MLGAARRHRGGLAHLFEVEEVVLAWLLLHHLLLLLSLHLGSQEILRVWLLVGLESVYFVAFFLYLLLWCLSF